MRSRILLGALFGTAGGIVGFLLQEFFTPHAAGSGSEIVFPAELLRLGWMVGAPLGLAIGAVEGVVVGSPRRLVIGMALGTVVGGLGGAFGVYWGSVLFSIALLGKTRTELELSPDLLDFVHLVIARGIGWMFLGAFPGLAAGAATLSYKRALRGLLGGLAGGLIGGILFDPVAKVTAPIVAPIIAAATRSGTVEIGIASRAVGFTIMGLLIGLLIGLVEDLFKQAWVRVLAGRNEGKDYIIGKPMTVLGRDERADVPLFGDPNLAPQHAAIRMENGRHVLLDGGAAAGSVVNGQRVQQQLLRDGDMIQLGQVRLLFREKATASRIGRPVADAPKAAQSPGSLAMPGHLCPFCGAAKDAAGNCLCTVPGIPSGAPGPATMPGAPAASAHVPPVAVGAPPYSAYGSPAPAYDATMHAAAPGSVLGVRGSTLVALDGPYAGQSFGLALPNVTVGRGQDNTISMMADVTVSRHHAHIADDGGRHVLYDDNSSNGTFVNNVRVQIQALAAGDVVQFGGSRYRYE